MATTFTTEKKRHDEATTLNALRTQIVNGAAQMLGAKTNLQNLKSKLEGDGDFDAADIAEVQSIIDLYVTERNKL